MSSRQITYSSPLGPSLAFSQDSIRTSNLVADLCKPSRRGPGKAWETKHTVYSQAEADVEFPSDKWKKQRVNDTKKGDIIDYQCKVAGCPYVGRIRKILQREESPSDRIVTAFLIEKVDSGNGAQHEHRFAKPQTGMSSEQKEVTCYLRERFQLAPTRLFKMNLKRDTPMLLNQLNQFINPFSN